MGKYLIQDIIPPEKRQRRTGAKKSADDNHDIVHPEHPIPIHRPKVVGQGAGHASFSENPRRMIVDQIEREDTEPVENLGHEEVSQVTHAPVEIKIEKPVEEMSERSESAYAEERASLPKNIPPRFPEYGVKRSWGGWSQWLPWLLGIGGVVAVLVIFLNFFAGTTVTIVSKHEAIIMDQKMVATKDALADDLPYAIMKETASSSLEVPATGEKTVTAKASGRIVVYNEQLTAQRLIKNTRFQSPAGKIYRINESINIPKGATKGGGITPGFLEVTVYADEAGPEYNSSPTDFTLPGLKDSPSKLFTKVYARSNGPLSGGARGTIKTVSDQDLKQAGEDLRVQLETKLRSKARGSLATFQIAYDQGMIVELSQPSLSKAVASADNKAVVSEEGTIYVITFKREDLIHSLARTLVPNYKGERIDIKNLDSLQFAIDSMSGSALVTGDKLTFTLKGTPELVWVVDEVALKNALLGISKNNFNGILAQYPAIDRAEADIRPRWKKVFPADPEKIKVVLTEKVAE